MAQFVPIIALLSIFLFVNADHTHEELVPYYQSQPSNSEGCVLHPDQDISTGFDILQTRVSSPSDCCARCQHNSQCKAFVYGYNTAPYNCFLKDNIRMTPPSSGLRLVAGVKEVPEPCNLHSNQDITTGFDIRQTRVSSPSECCDQCHQVNQCIAFVYGYNTFPYNCFLKNSTRMVTSSPGLSLVAGVKTVFEGFSLHPNQDISTGYDVLQTRLSGPSVCGQLCKQNSQCRAYVYGYNTSPYNCFLKDNTRMTTASPGLSLLAGVETESL